MRRLSRLFLVFVSVSAGTALAWGPNGHNKIGRNAMHYWTITPFVNQYGLNADSIGGDAYKGDLSEYKDTFHSPQWEMLRSRLYLFDPKWGTVAEPLRLSLMLHNSGDSGVPMNHSPGNQVWSSSTIEPALEARVELFGDLANITPLTGTYSQQMTTFYNQVIALANWTHSNLNLWNTTFGDEGRHAGWLGTTYGQQASVAMLLDYFLAKQPTVANANGSYAVNPGENVTFSSAGSYDPDSVTVNADGSYYQNYQGITSWEWDLNNDGIYETLGASPTRSYSELLSLVGPTEGRTIRLRVRDDEGSTYLDSYNNAGVATATSTIAVYTPPTANAHGSYAVYPGGSVSFDSSGSGDPDGGSVSYLWTIGNYTTSSAGPVLSYSSLLNYLGPTEGQVISLRVTDNEGVSTTTTTTAAVYVPPTAAGRAQYGWLGKTGDVPSNWDWDNLVDAGSADPDHTANPAAGITTWSWDLNNDGTIDKSGPSSVRVTYADFAALGITANENQTVTLTVTDNEGQTATQSGIAMPVLVNPTANAGGPYSVWEGGSVSLSGSGTDPDGGSITAYDWDVKGDETYPVTGAAPTVSYDYLVSTLGVQPSESGRSITLRVTDNDEAITGWWAGTGTANAILKVYANPLAAGKALRGWLGRTDEVPAGRDVDLLVDAGSADPDNTENPGAGITTWGWDLNNDGTIDKSGRSSLWVTYADFAALGITANENHTVTLTVTDNEGQTATRSGIAMPVLVNPTANAGGPYSVWEGGSVSLSGSGTDPDGGSITAYEWDLKGDGTYSVTGATPTVSYDYLVSTLGVQPSESGRSITLRVTDNDEAITGSWAGTGTATTLVKVYANPLAAGKALRGWLGRTDEVPAGRDVDLLVDAGSVDPDNTENPGAGITTWGWDLNNDGTIDKSGRSSLWVTYADFAALGITANENHTVTLTVTDNEGQTATRSGIAMPVLVNPTANAGGPYEVTGPDGILQLAGSGVDPDGGVITAFAWDLDNDGVFDDGIGASLLLSVAELAAMGLPAGRKYPIYLKVTDDDAAITGGAWAGTAVANATLAIYPSIGGDANTDGRVSFEDFCLLQNAFGRAGDWWAGDFNLDGMVNFADFAILQNHYGQVASAPVAQVPEPLSVLLLAMGVICGTRRKLRFI